MSFMKRLWSKAKPIEIQVNGEVYSVAFSPDARHVIGGGQGKTVGRWVVEKGRRVGEPMELPSYLLNIAVSKDGQLVVLGGSSSLAEVWDTKTHKKLVQVTTSMRVFGVDVSPDSTKFVTGSEQNVIVWSISTGEQLLGPLRHTNFVAAVKFSPGGERIATATWETNSIRLYDSSDGQLLAEIPDRVSSLYNTSLVWSGDGRQLFIASHTGKIKCFHVSGSFLSWTEWDVRANNQPTCIALSSNGKFIASASSRLISFWDTSTHVRIGPVIEQSERVWSIALSSDGHLASGGDDKKIVLRNLKNILPRSYFLDSSDVPSGSQALSQSMIVQQDNSLAEVVRLETLLGERDKTIQESKKEKETLERTIRSLSAALYTQEENLGQLEQEIVNLKATVQGLRTQVSEAQGVSRKLSKRLDETSEVADGHKLEAERVKAALDELQAKHRTELAQALKNVVPDPEIGYRPPSRGIGIDVFESWTRNHAVTANTAFPEETDNYSTADYNALAYGAFAQARSGNWSAAYEEAQKSVNIQPSAIGHIARALALIGQQDHKAAMRAFALVFRDGDPNENELMLVIWGVLSCMAGEYIDGILRVHNLANTAGTERTVHNSVQAYMYILQGNRDMKDGEYERAIQLFDRARTLGSSHASPRLEIISLISGWRFEGLEMMAQQHLREAMQAAGRMKAPSEPLVQVYK